MWSSSWQDQDRDRDRDEAARGVELQPATDVRDEEMASQTLGAGIEVGDNLSNRKVCVSFMLDVSRFLSATPSLSSPDAGSVALA